MPTDVVKKIGATNTPTPMAYSTVQAWEDACPADLTAVDQRWIGEVYNQGTLGFLNISGETTDATRYLWLRAAAGQSFRDSPTVRTTPLTFSTTVGAVLSVTHNYANMLDISTGYTHVTGLMLANLGAASTLTFNVAVVIDACVIASGLRAVAGNHFGSTFTNCLILNKGTYGVAQGLLCGNCYNCTVIQAVGTGTYGLIGNVYGPSRNHFNCAVFGFTNLTYGANGGGSDYAATDATAALEGAHTVSGLVASAQFVNAVTDFRAVQTGGLQVGTSDPTNAPVDITGFTRASQPYIGCWEGLSGPYAQTINMAVRPTSAQVRGPGVRRAAVSPAVTEWVPVWDTHAPAVVPVVGQWVDEPFNAANYWTIIGSWAVASTYYNTYSRIGNVLIWSLAIYSSTLSSGSNNVLFAKLPGGFTQSMPQNTFMVNAPSVSDGTGSHQDYYVAAGGSNYVQIARAGGATIAAGPFAIQFTITLKVD